MEVIINIGDRGALEPWPDYAHHGVSKAGLLALTRLTAASEAPLIRANMVIPGLVLKPDTMPEPRWLIWRPPRLPDGRARPRTWRGPSHFWLSNRSSPGPYCAWTAGRG